MVENITPEEVQDRIDNDDPLQIVDVRNEGDFASSQIPTAENIPLHDLEDEIDEVDWEDEIAVVCAVGKSSQQAAKMLEASDETGDATIANVEDGMEGWNHRAWAQAEIQTDNDDLELIQLQRRATGCLAYMVGSKSAGEAAVIDATRHPDMYQEVAEEAGYEITSVFDTHIHADHLTGGRILAEEVDATYYASKFVETRDPEFEYTPLDRNEVIQVGDIDIKSVYTPGHTTDMSSYLVEDEALMTGDTIFVESIGRTELQFTGDGAKDGARTMYETLHGTVMSMPDSIKILPAHFSVRPDGTAIDVTPGEPIQATVGYLRKHNNVLQLPEEEFVEHMFDNLPSKPPNYEQIIETNLGHREPEDEDEARQLEMGPNSCAASEESMVSDDD
ncbi:MBL fold metallo-hydrolase [Natrialbaceae archaeon AArc-T1-2]|uniref:MBL fold metallo-hydrolase n=1 Tax=Natrialbaceae archaeon AArc-T1-2 TaxID=3053904 RepID=UPI00255AEF47|nr:rhodanese-like domain-containing protein [Natrialbaceae archaeon AArc-T1-2]WIV68198.1 rhodanese-like domain-containing protein [Natrialbaceae archaeon AArc-T1-2]